MKGKLNGFIFSILFVVMAIGGLITLAPQTQHNQASELAMSDLLKPNQVWN